MYIASVEINGICCFDHVKINFKLNNEPIKVATILGDNGTGKTTIMRCIAMGLCEKSGAVGLLQELYGDWINKNKNEGTIYIKFIYSDQKIYKEAPFIKRIFKRTESENIEIEEETYPDPFPWNDIFACGYGASRSSLGTKDYGEYVTVDSVYTLFNYDSKLQNPELIIRRIKDIDLDQFLNERSGANAKKSEIRKLLNKILLRIDRILALPEGSTQLSKSGISVSGPWGNFMPYMSLGDGYRATIAWISDLLGWALFYDETMFNTDISGIVLVDEIEQHLHPSWQRKITRTLNQQFPKIQFIFTTHSPLVAANAGKLFRNDVASKLFHLRYEGENSRISEVEEKLGQLNLNQILSSEAFDYISEAEINPKIEELLRKSSELAAKDDRSEEEEQILIEFKAKLRELMFPKSRTLIERIVESDYHKELEEQIEDFQKIFKKQKNDQN